MTGDALQRAWVTLILTPGLGPARVQRLRHKIGTPVDILAAPDSELRSSGLTAKLIDALHQPNQERFENTFEWLGSSANHHLLTIDDPAYPPLLQTIDHPPQALFINGNPSILSSWQLAIVGSRNPSSSGRETAYNFSQYLANSNLTITSGMALGIDAAGHEGALDAGKPTIAVTGNGLDRVYPAKHRDLAHRIANNGALVSEFPPGTKPLAQNFPRRNRIISGLSLGTLVVEAAQKSGSLITAYKALEQSREVFAIPGSIHNPLARGCHQLIRQGAKLVETGQDILEELGALAQATLEMATEKPAGRSAPEANKPPAVHQQVLEAMAFDPVSIDTLAKRTGLSAGTLSSILLILELEGAVNNQAGGHYIRNS